MKRLEPELSMKERQFPRYRVDQSLVAIVFWDDMPVAKISGRCVVLGEGGFGATLSGELYLGDVVRIQMPPVPPVYAKVCHVRGAEHGLQFLYSGYGQREAVNKLCSQGAPVGGVSL